MEKYLYKQECYNIIGAAMEVHNELGHGFLEPVYQEALSIILEEKGIPFVKEQVLDIHFKGRMLKKSKTDLLINFGSPKLQYKRIIL